MPTRAIPGGLLIAIEGIDGAGKTTLADGLRDVLARTGAKITFGKEPTRGPWGAKLRESAATGRLTVADEKRFLLLDRRQHVDEVIRPALTRGEIVILDRYYPSMVAYQGAAGIPVDELMQDNRFAPRPDLLLLLDLEPEEGLRRICARGDQPNAFETMDNLRAVRGIFLDMDDPHLSAIDARQSIDAVLAQSWKQVVLALTEKFRAENGLSVETVEAVAPYLAGAL